MSQVVIGWRAIHNITIFHSNLYINATDLAPVMLQVVIGWHAADGSVRERGVTRQIRVTLSPAEFVRGIDAVSTGLLLAKQVTWEGSRQGSASDRGAVARLRLAVGNPPPPPLFISSNKRIPLFTFPIPSNALLLLPCRCWSLCLHNNSFPQMFPVSLPFRPQVF